MADNTQTHKPANPGGVFILGMMIALFFGVLIYMGIFRDPCTDWGMTSFCTFFFVIGLVMMVYSVFRMADEPEEEENSNSSKAEFEGEDLILPVILIGGLLFIGFIFMDAGRPFESTHDNFILFCKGIGLMVLGLLALALLVVFSISLIRKSRKRKNARGMRAPIFLEK